MAGAPAAAEARVDEIECLQCDEGIDTTQTPWVYYHRFNDPGDVLRQCGGISSFGGDEHEACHNDPVEGDCGTHPNCTGGGGSLAMIAEIRW